MTFENGKVAGFEAKNHLHKKQVEVWEYDSDDAFVIELKTKAENDHILLIKNKKIKTAEQAIEKVNSLKEREGHLNKSDIFEMPKVSLKHNRSVK